jgi:hypothetical protein
LTSQAADAVERSRRVDDDGLATRLVHSSAARRRAVAGVALAALLVGCALLVILACAPRSYLTTVGRTSTPSWLRWPLRGLFGGWSPPDYELRAALNFGMPALFLCYAGVLAGVRDLRARVAIGATVVAQLMFLLAPPLRLTDLFNYIVYARMGVVHGLNPYSHVPASVFSDPAFRFSTWHHLPSPYGPLFTLGSYAIAPLSLPVAYWMLKVATVAASLGTLALVAACARRLGRDVASAVVFVGLNPAVLVFGLGGFHNDVFLMLLVVGGVYLLLASREGLAGGALAAAVMIKASAGVLLPIIAMRARRPTRAWTGALAAGGILAAVSLVTFGPHGPSLKIQSNLVAPLSLPSLTGRLLGVGGATPTLRLLATGLAVLAVLTLAWAVRRGRIEFLVAAGWAVLALVASLSWVVPWYVYWALPFAALAAQRSLKAAALIASVLVTLMYLPGTIDALRALDFHPRAGQLAHQQERYLHHFLR